MSIKAQIIEKLERIKNEAALKQIYNIASIEDAFTPTYQTRNPKCKRGLGRYFKSFDFQQ